jgi:hypothetical protein
MTAHIVALAYAVSFIIWVVGLALLALASAGESRRK